MPTRGPQEVPNKQGGGGRKPVARVSVGSVQGAIWRNENAGKVYYAVTFETRYKDAQDNWQSGSNFGQMDCLALAKAADRAHDAITRLRLRDKADADTGGL